MVALWAAEEARVSRMLVLLPSLSLLAQTLEEWKKHSKWRHELNYLCVCSDPTVDPKNDEIAFNPSNAKFRIDTDPLEVRRFLKSPGKIKIVLSTYHSAPVVADGICDLPPFDLAIFDEAHKTTGLLDKAFAFALHDKNIQIHKRLFLTATPKHYDILHRDLAGDFNVGSMDDKKAFGPRAHTLTFGQAVEQKIICPCKIIISLVDGKEVSNFALRNGVTFIESDAIGAKWVATQLAIKQAIKKTGARSVITFHSKVSQARDFASASPRGIAQHLSDCEVYHVNARQQISDRRNIVAAFREARRALITNARCLVEGVDIPAVDMVVFVDPKRSKVDIVQATGRAMRRAPHSTKTFGYVVVPIFANAFDRNSIEDAVKKLDFTDIAVVLNAMQQQDEDIVQIIRDLNIAKGMGVVLRTNRLTPKIEIFAPFVRLKALKNAIYIAVVNRMGFRWDEIYGRLVAFSQLHGHSNVPQVYPPDRALGHWVSEQRARARSGTLDLDRIGQLNKLGFSWNTRVTLWEEMFQCLVAFKDKHGHVNVRAMFSDTRLANWFIAQRHRKTIGKLSEDRVKLLTQLGVQWDPQVSRWDRMFTVLCSFVETNGHSHVSSRDPNRKLVDWVANVRTRYKEGKLSVERIKLLEQIGFKWHPRWDWMFERLCAFEASHGHANPSSKDDVNLAAWIIKQRRQKGARKLSAHQLQRLESVNFIW